MDIFPIGTISAASNLGDMSGIKYKLYEPNGGSRSNSVYTTLISQFSEQTILTRKKALPYLNLKYVYANIFSREYRQIEHFIDKMDDALTSFSIVDFSKGQTQTAVASPANNTWTVDIDDTRIYSATTNQKANVAMLWNGKGQWKLGALSGLTANASLTLDIQPNNYGRLPLDNISTTNTLVYPVYTAYLLPNQLANFTTGVYLEGHVSLTSNGGYMYSGDLNFVSKYKVV